MVRVALICPYCASKNDPNIKELESEKIKGPIIITCSSCGARIDVIRLAVAHLIKEAEEGPSPKATEEPPPAPEPPPTPSF